MRELMTEYDDGESEEGKAVRKRSRLEQRMYMSRFSLAMHVPRGG
jgi:hypothetical protein